MFIAIDTHSHYNHGSRFDSTESEIYCAGLSYLKEGYDAAGIEMAFCSTFASVLSCEEVEAENEYNRRMCETIPWLYQWVVIDPRNRATFRQAEEMLQSPKCVGIKIHPPYHGYSILDYADEIFSFAARFEAVVQMHPDAIPQMPAFADKYPDMTLIIAHLGSVEHVDAVAAARHGNIYVDTSGRASTFNRMLEYAVERIGSERILFGTDTYAASFQRGRVEFSPISRQDKENILRNNALRLFGEKLGR